MRDHFTIHGLWPSSRTESLNNCELYERFDAKELAPIRRTYALRLHATDLKSFRASRELS